MNTVTKPSPPIPEQLAPLLAEFIKRASPPRQVQQVRIEDLRLLTGGASRQTWSFDAIVEQTDGQIVTLPLVLRSDPQEGPQSVMERSLEYRVIEAAYAEGVLVPKPYSLGDDSPAGPSLPRGRMEGNTTTPRLFAIQPTARPVKSWRS